MPYNTTAIVPSEEVTGAAVLPLARVKKTINADEDIGNVSAQAAFVICKATEIFVQYASEKSYDIAKADAKPKRSLTYSHVSNAVARNDNLEFLSDIAPQTTTWRTYKVNQAAQAASQQRRPRTSAGAIDPRQTTLGGLAATGGAGPSVGETATSTPSRGDLSIAMNPAEAFVNGSGPVNGDSKKVDGDGDVHMA